VGVVLLILVGIITEYTLYILVSTSVSVNCFTYQEVMRRAFGRAGYMLVAVVQFATAFTGECYQLKSPLLAWCDIFLPLSYNLLSPSIF